MTDRRALVDLQSNFAVVGLQLNEHFDVGVFTAEPRNKGYRRESVLRTERRILQTGKQTIELVVEQRLRTP